MGQDKLWLPWSGAGDKTVLTAVVEVVRAVTPEVTLLVPPGGDDGDYAAYAGRGVAKDAVVHAGPLAALARSWPVTVGDDLVFVVAGDLPGITSGVLTACRAALDTAGTGCDGAVVCREGRRQPLIGCYRQRAGQAWQTAVATGETRLLAALEKLNLVSVDADELRWPKWWTRPVHTPADYEAWLAWHAAGPAGESAQR